MELCESRSPGEFIYEVYLKDMKISRTTLADALHIGTGPLSRLIGGKTELSPNMALKLSLVLGRSPESWMALQAKTSLSLAKKDMDFKDYTRITPED